jgi:hypothetical protein
MSPPGKRNGVVQTPVPNHLNSPRAYHAPSLVQSRIVWNGWGRSRSHRVEQMRREIDALRLVQAPLGFLFWRIEKRIGRLDVEIERMLS